MQNGTKKEKSIMDYYNDIMNAIGHPEGKTNRDTLEETLGAIDRDYENSKNVADLPEAPTYERMDYTPPTDEEIAKQAEAGLTEYKQTSVEKIDKDTEATRLAKENEKQALAASAAKQYAAIAEEYDKAAADFSDDALKRGIARSSIAANKTAEIQNGKATALSEARVSAENEVRAIETEIAGLEDGRRKALDNFNIAYAAKVTERIAELTEARDRKAAEVLKYNNGLLEREQADAIKRAQALSGLYSDSLDQQKKENELGDTPEAAKQRNSAKYEAVRNYLLGMGKSEAADAVRTDPLIRDSLTDYYYYSLYNEFCK